MKGKIGVDKAQFPAFRRQVGNIHRPQMEPEIGRSGGGGTWFLIVDYMTFPQIDRKIAIRYRQIRFSPQLDGQSRQIRRPAVQGYAVFPQEKDAVILGYVRRRALQPSGQTPGVGQGRVIFVAAPGKGSRQNIRREMPDHAVPRLRRVGGRLPMKGILPVMKAGGKGGIKVQQFARLLPQMDTPAAKNVDMDIIPGGVAAGGGGNGRRFHLAGTMLDDGLIKKIVVVGSGKEQDKGGQGRAHSTGQGRGTGRRPPQQLPGGQSQQDS